MTPDQVVATARTWIGTPYVHQHRKKGLACDCLGFVAGVLEELSGVQVFVQPYSPSWDEAQKTDYMLTVARQYLVDKRHDPYRPGDVLVFRMVRDATAKHCAIVATPTTMIHARQGHAVCEEALVPYWTRRIAGVFMIPGVH